MWEAGAPIPHQVRCLFCLTFEPAHLQLAWPGTVRDLFGPPCSTASLFPILVVMPAWVFLLPWRRTAVVSSSPSQVTLGVVLQNSFKFSCLAWDHHMSVKAVWMVSRQQLPCQFLDHKTVRKRNLWPSVLQQCSVWCSSSFVQTNWQLGPSVELLW